MWHVQGIAVVLACSLVMPLQTWDETSECGECHVTPHLATAVVLQEPARVAGSRDAPLDRYCRPVQIRSERIFALYGHLSSAPTRKVQISV